MKRDPSIHLRESVLRQIVFELYTELDKWQQDLPTVGDHDIIVDWIMEKGKGLSCNNRSMLISNQRIEKKAISMVKANKGDTDLLSNLIHKTRRKLRHKGIRRIQQDSKEWDQLKELTSICIDFCNEFNLEKRAGFIEYIKIGLSKIKSFRQYISKLKNMAETIFNEYEHKQLILEDPNSEETRAIHDLYVSMITKNTGIGEKYYDKPITYYNFVKVRELTDELDIPYDIFLEAQFNGLAWADSFPDPHQLVGDKAMERLNKYMFKNKIKKKSKKDNSTIDKVTLLKNLRQHR